MSPEQVRAEGVDHRSDLFSFGVVLYELLAREHPFRRETVTATLTAILHDPAGELSKKQAGIAPGVERIVERCLDKKRDERFQSAQDLAAGARSRAAGGKRGGDAIGGGGAQPLSRALVVHGRGRESLLRPRAGSQGALGEAPRAAAFWR